MSTMQTRLGDARNWIENHRAQTLAVLVLLAAIIFIIGLTMTWFVSSKSLSTVGKIQTPAQLKIMGPNQTSIEPIEISYDESRGDVKNSDGTVTIRRAFCVKSNNESNDGGHAFELQVANTTNITELTINVYRVTVNNPSTTTGDVVGLDGLKRPYSWSKKKDGPISFVFINSADGTSALAQELADNDPTYGTYKSVQKNARPLYRYHEFTKSQLDGYSDKNKRANDATNFIIECTWNPGVVTVNGKTVSNVKETDMVYLIARGMSGANN